MDKHKIEKLIALLREMHEREQQAYVEADDDREEWIHIGKADGFKAAADLLEQALQEASQ